MPPKKAAAAGAGGASSIPAGKLQEMQQAVSQKDDAHTLRLLAAHPALLNAPLDASGRTALMHSAHNGRCNNVRALLRHGADVDAQTASGATAAWYAAAASKPTALRLLLRAGADPTAAVKEARGGWRSIFDVARCVGLRCAACVYCVRMSVFFCLGPFSSGTLTRPLCAHTCAGTRATRTCSRCWRPS